MARRKARIPEGKKVQPAVKTMTFTLPSTPAATNYYIDLSQCASILNRRFYRQGLNWAVAGFTWYTVNDGSIRINKVPDTWVAANAWMKGFATWQKMNKEALAEAGSVKPKFLDFKVFMDAGHHAAGSAANLLPRVGSDVGIGNSDVTPGEWEYSSYVIPDTTLGATGGVQEREIVWTGSVKPKFLDFKVFMDAGHHAAGSAANLLPRVGSDVGIGNSDVTPGEWEYSSYVIPDTTLGATGGVQEREIVWTGANYPGAGGSGLNAVSLIEGYAASRGLPDILDPNAPADAADADGVSPENWQSALFSEGSIQDDVVLGAMIDENNQAPYPFENDGTHVDTQYPGGANQNPGLQESSLAFVTGTTIGGRTEIRGDTFQGGLINLELAHTGTSVFQVHLVPGNHRGYMCHDMKEL